MPTTLWSSGGACGGGEGADDDVLVVCVVNTDDEDGVHAPPTVLAASKIVGRKPAWINCLAATRPLAPAPITATSSIGAAF